MSIQNITASELNDWLCRLPASDYVLLDVREESEVAICAIQSSLYIPMNWISLRHNELPDDVPIVVYCHHGVRSLNVARYLEHVGFDDLYNLHGGIDAWAQTVEPDMARY